jgi:hypothetical protein
MVLYNSLIDGNGRLYRGKVMKRILSGGLVFLCFFWCVDLVFGSAINSLTIGKRQAVSSPANVVYRGTLTGLRISSVDGTAFIDNAGETVPTYADGNHQISIFDSSGRELRGVLKAAGESEGLGDELLPDPGFDNDDAWIKQAGWSVLGGKGVATAAASGNHIYTSSLVLPTGTGQLMKQGITIDSISSGGIRFTDSAVYVSSTETTTGNKTWYYTKAMERRFYIQAISTTTAQVDTATAKQVLTPSSSGATIVSTKGGTTRNFTQKNSSFFYNANSYYVIVRKMP